MKIVDFKKGLVSLQTFIYFDENDFLREKCSNENALQKLINEFERAILDWKSSSSFKDLLFLHGSIGNLYRIKGDAKLAIETLSKAVELSEGTMKLVNLIRLGEALKYAGQHQQALSNFNVAIDQCAKQEHSQLLDFAYQHKGKCLLELKEVSEANEYFRKAMDLRVRKGDESLIDSTQRALNFIKRHGGLE